MVWEPLVFFSIESKERPQEAVFKLLRLGGTSSTHGPITKTNVQNKNSVDGRVEENVGKSVSRWWPRLEENNREERRRVDLKVVATPVKTSTAWRGSGSSGENVGEDDGWEIENARERE
ncbi:hypothetical protein CRG98_031060 [Punica granatum]|uniref:Uncharacterized protein n=1 Tax=Punica granatum TaxID=22663 RepID=A0A2I0IWY2_PUNGR|nr:hypothetical protein CRG98_031060 [Punica granatum]